MDNYFALQDKIEDISFLNRICINPMEGSDALPDGSPGPLTYRRYEKFAKNNPGIIWFEAVAVCEEGKASKNQLHITEHNLIKFHELTAFIKNISPKTRIICQLTHSGRFSRPDGTPKPLLAAHDPFLDARYPAHANVCEASDGYLDSVTGMFEKSVGLVKDAGFDGADIKVCHRYLLSELLASFTRKGRYGGSFENRSRLTIEIFRSAQKFADSEFILCSRFGIYDAIQYPFGFGVNATDKIEPDFSEPVMLLKNLRDLGLTLINVTMGTPYYNAYINKPHKSEFEDPEKCVDRLLEGAAVIKREIPGLKIVSTGYSYLKDRAYEKGNLMLAKGKADFIGFGRLAFAYPFFADDILKRNLLDEKKCCIACNKCSELLRAGNPAGCVIREQETYLPYYRALVSAGKSAAPVSEIKKVI